MRDWLIGTVRRECLDRTLFWTTTDLQEKLLDFQHYYNEHRTHAGRQGQPPETGNADRGVGEYDPPNSALLPSLPEHPEMDKLLWQESTGMAPDVRIGLPAFRFTSR